MSTATIKEIARKANVSIATVSRALSNDAKVKHSTKVLIERVAKELDYKPNILARNFVKKQSNIVCLILPDIADEFFSDLIKSVDEASYAMGYFTMITSSHKLRSIEEAVHTFIANGLAGSIIALIPSLSPELERILKNTEIPIVLLGASSVVERFDSVSIANYDGVAELLDYLIKVKGYRKIAHITGPMDNNDSLERFGSYKDTLEKNGIEFNGDYIGQGDFTQESGKRECIKLLKLTDRPQLIFASNDMMAIGCYQAIKEFGLRIPEDIGVVGFDNIFTSCFLSPSLTTVDVSIELMGRSAADIAIRRMRSELPEAKQKIKIPTKIVFRESC